MAIAQQLEAVARPLMLARKPKSLAFYRKLGQRALLPPGSGEMAALAIHPVVPPPAAATAPATLPPAQSLSEAAAAAPITESRGT